MQTPNRKRSSRVLKVVAGLLFRRGRLLICQRTEEQTMPLQWEFPGGKIERGELPADALHRELEEELGIDAVIGAEVTRLEHHYPRSRTVELRFFVVEEWKGEMQNRIFQEIRWTRLKELPRFRFLEADRKLVKNLAAGGVAGISERAEMT